MPKETHKLAAIMFSDIVGYTSLMGSDEDRAFDILRANLEIHSSAIEQFNGKLIKEMGDGMLISFNLASEAVRCAIEIQKACKEKGIPLRIGIHEGEMVFAGNDVLGDGVNIASRLHQAAGEGCISISGTVYNDVKNKAGIESRFLEEKTFKNVDDPVKVYNVICEEEISTTEKQRFPEKKSIIVLPFENMSSEPEQEYFSDGLTEEIITDLSHINDLLVISRSSAMTFKNTKKRIKEIAKEVNVRYVLEGSVRKSGNNLRITAQLIDGVVDAHIWAEKYHGTLDDVFEIQEKVSRSIVDTLKVKLSPEENKSISIKPIEDFKAYEFYLKARQEYWRCTEESLEKALRLLQQGFELTGDNELLYAAIGSIYWQYVNLMIKPGKDYGNYLEDANKCVNKVFELNPDSSVGYVLQGFINQNRGKPEQAISNFSLALENDPNNPEALMGLGYHLTACGKEEIGRDFIEKAAKLDPFNPVAQGCIGWPDFFRGNFESAKNSWHKSCQTAGPNPIFDWTYAYFLAMNNQTKEAIDILDTIEIDISRMKPWENLCLFQSYTLKGQRKEALQVVSPELTEAAKWDDIYSLFMAECFALLNETKQAVMWLENTIQYGIINYPFLNEYNPLLENIRKDEQFEKLMEKVKYEYETFALPVQF